jgi:Zn-dependent protease
LVLFVFSITIHEISHGYAAYMLGDPTAKNMGRLTLNPLAHLDLWGTLLILFAGFGWAKPVPIDPRYFKKPSRDMAIVSIAGPLSNLLISFVSIFILMKVTAPLFNKGIITENYFNALNLLLGSLATLNIALAVFNLLPIPPLDGSKILLAVAPYSFRNFIFSIERYGIIVLFLFLSLISPIISKISQFIINTIVKIINFLPF